MFNKMKKIRAAISRDDASQMKNLSNKKTYRETCMLAIESGAPNALRALLEKNGKFYLTTGNGDANEARKLVQKAYSSSNPVPLLSVLYEINQTTRYGKLSDSEFLNKDTHVDFLRDILKKDSSLFSDCIHLVGLQSPENQKLKTILNFVAPNAQAAIDNALVQVAKTGDITKAQLLLEYKGNPNNFGAEALLRAAEGGHQDMVDLLLPLVKPALCGDIVSQLERNEALVQPSVITSIAAAAQKTLIPQQQPQPQQSATNGFTPINDHTLMETATLPGRGTLSTIFDFSAGVATIINDKGRDAQPGLTTRGHEKYDPQFIQERREKLAELLAGPKKTVAQNPHAYPNVG